MLGDIRYKTRHNHTDKCLANDKNKLTILGASLADKVSDTKDLLQGVRFDKS